MWFEVTSTQRINPAAKRSLSQPLAKTLTGEIAEIWGSRNALIRSDEHTSITDAEP